MQTDYMEPRTKKNPADYPQLLFRLSKEDKDLIEAQIEEIVEILNANIGPRQIKAKKGQVAVEALKRGLVELRTEYSNKKFTKKTRSEKKV